MKQITLIVFLLLFLSNKGFGSPPLQLTLATIDFPPYVICDNVKPSGINIDLLNIIALRHNIEFTIHCMPWKRALSLTASGEIDGAFPALKTDERELYADYVTTPLNKNEQYFLFTRQDSPLKYDGVESLNNLSVSIDQGHAISNEFHRAANQGLFTLTEEPTSSRALIQLVQKHSDAYTNNYIVIEYLSRQMGIRDQLKRHVKPVATLQASYLMLSKKMPIRQRHQLLSYMNKSLNMLWLDGTVERLTKHYLPNMDNEPNN